VTAPARSAAWKWWVCGLLLLATMINYMDRLTINQTAARIKEELHLSNEQYGQVESAFGIAFAFGAMLVGWVVDRANVRWIYPAVLLAWSAAGFATGFAQGFVALVVCRFVLGLFEAGHWPCALRTTQRILPPAERTLGNSLLQSGAAIGAVLTPLIVQALVSTEGTWRRPFFVIGAAGTIWVFFWLAVVRRDDLAHPPPSSESSSEEEAFSLWTLLTNRRFWVLIVIVTMINQTWHFFRVWMPLFLGGQHHYSESAVNYFTSAYYAATDAGALTSGFVALHLARRGLAVHLSRVLVFLCASLLTALSIAVAFLPSGPLLLGLLLVIGFGALGLFPPFYSLSQDLTVRHQGKLTGILGFTTWMVSAVMHPQVGKWVDRTKDYTAPLVLVGLLPLVAFAALALFWGKAPTVATSSESKLS
jgi:ACS family hexuronate transporter-like MFS transporter